MATGGPRGPVPKRTEVRRRRNKSEVEPRKAPAAPAVRVPEPDPEWHPIAQEMFRAAGVSGQRQFFEESDWASLRFYVEMASRLLFSERPSANMAAVIGSGLSDHLFSEGARRRARIELERGPVEEPQSVGIMKRYGGLRVISGRNQKAGGRTKLA